MKMLSQPRPLLAFALFLLLALGGCATKPAAPKKYTFFPPSPDTPRIQFLTDFSSQADMHQARKFADFIVGEQKTTDPLIKPYGLAAHDGQVYVCDTVAGNIEVFDFKKHQSSYFAPVGEGRFGLPQNITIDTDGTRYVADTGRAQVLIYGPDGTFLEALGMRGDMKPCDVAVSPDRLYVADLLNHCVKVFSKADHKLLLTIPSAKDEKVKLFSPTNLALDPARNRLLVADTGANTVQIFDLDGNFVRSLGHTGVAPGMFARPKGVAVDHQGNAYVVDAAAQVAQVFNTDGQLLMYFGQPGASTQGQLALPAVIKLDYDSVPYFQKFAAPGHQFEYLIFVTNQVGPDKVSVYGFLKQN
jgi:DNA-binding beta-propeller fold protein YncE